MNGSAANEQDVYADSILSSDELRQMFMQREYTSRDVERLLISHAALINKVKWLESKQEVEWWKKLTPLQRVIIAVLRGAMVEKARQDDQKRAYEEAIYGGP